MFRSKITSKGQTTLPKEIRDHLGLSAGDCIDFIVLDNGTVVVKPAYIDVSDLSGILEKSVHGKKISIEEMNNAIRSRFGKIQ